MATVTTTCSGLDGVVGCDYLRSLNQLIFVESDGDIDLVNLNPPHAHQFGVGQGYKTLQDIKISRDGRHAYVTELQGNLLRVDLLHPNRSSATLVSSGMTAPHQIVLDEDHNLAYVVEFAPSGSILRIDLGSSKAAINHTPVASGLQNAVGLLMTADGSFAYVSEQTGGHISRIQLNNGNKTHVVSGLIAPYFLSWLGEGEHTILTTESDTANQVVLIDLTQSPAAHTEIAKVPPKPSSVCVVGPDQVYVGSEQVISKLSLTEYSVGSPILMGIGFVPADHIKNGFATTDPGYFFKVVDAPFGGSLPIMFNHDRARDMGAAYYQIVVDNVDVDLPVTQYADYCWDGTHFVLKYNPATPGLYYDVHAASDIWYNPWLGAFVDSTGLKGLHTIAIRLFNASHAEIGKIIVPHPSVQVMIDNGWPIASIDKILHNGAEVPTCAIEHLGEVDKWTFLITARDPEKHLKSWSLIATWGNNMSAWIDGGDYDANISTKPLWEGLPPAPNKVPLPPKLPWKATVTGDSTSTNCAHTFILGVWDRVIDGWNWLHYAEYYKSITIIH